MNVYQATSATAPVLPVIVQGNANFTYYNCAVEPSGGRALATMLAASDTMTVEYCLSIAYNYAWAALEYGRECFAGNSLDSAATNATSASQCGKVCAGNSTVCFPPASILNATNKNLGILRRCQSIVTLS